MLIINPFQKINTYLVIIQKQIGWTPTITDKSSIELSFNHNFNFDFSKEILKNNQSRQQQCISSNENVLITLTKSFSKF